MRFVLGFCLVLVSLVARADLVNVESSSLQALMAKGIAVVDVRRADEWMETGVVPGSHKMTFFDEHGDYDAKAWLEELDRIVDKDRPVILICRVGVRSKVIANWLTNGLGYSEVYNVSDGILGWIGGGNGVVRE